MFINSLEGIFEFYEYDELLRVSSNTKFSLASKVIENVYRYSSISTVSISAVFDLLQFMIRSYFPPL